jgi:hypothetical protein
MKMFFGMVLLCSGVASVALAQTQCVESKFAYDPMTRLTVSQNTACYNDSSLEFCLPRHDLDNQKYVQTRFPNVATCYQKKGTAGNKAAGYGLCSLDRSKRRRAKRGPHCVANLNGATDAGIENQVRCCKYIMEHTPHYFGPVNKGRQKKCS